MGKDVSSIKDEVLHQKAVQDLIAIEMLADILEGKEKKSVQHLWNKSLITG